MNQRTRRAACDKKPRDFNPWASVRRLLPAAAVALALLAGCSRLQQANARLDAIASDQARGLVRDCLWEHGSVPRWVEHQTVRCEVERIEHAPVSARAKPGFAEATPGGDRVSREVWILDTAGDRVRIEQPDADRVIVANDMGVGLFVGGKRAGDLESRDAAVGLSREVRELLVMPFSLLDPGLEIAWLGSETGPAEARVWDRLLVYYGRGSGASSRDRAVVEIRRETSRVEAVIVRWSELPFLGRRYRVEMDDWRPEEDLLVSHRWQLFPADETGRAAGPARWTVRVKRWEWDAAAPPVYSPAKATAPPVYSPAKATAPPVYSPAKATAPPVYSPGAK
jgi:hypothetical protein